MQYIRQTHFEILTDNSQKPVLTISKQKKRIEKPKIVCAKISTDRTFIVCGLSDGSIAQFINQKFNHKKLTQCKQYQSRIFKFPNMHKGQIKCLLVEKIFKLNLVITGSVDRTIKIWDTQPKTKDVVQTLTGHTGSILCITYSKKTDTLFSASNDKTVRIWKQDEGRKMFMYPWYICYQTLTQFTFKKLQVPVYPTSLDLHDGQVGNFTLYIGDSSGSLHIVRQLQLINEHHNMYSSQDSHSKIRTAFEIDRSNYNYHRLTINCIVYVGKQHLVLTCSYDQKIFGFQSLSDKLIFKYENPRKCLFTAMIWYCNMLVAADEQGVLYCIEINSDKGIQELKKYNCKILDLVNITELQEIVVVTENFVDVIRLVKGIKAVEGDNSHTDSIIGLFALQTFKLTQKKIKDNLKIISVSLDNTMRIWDPNDLTCLQVLYNAEKSQITCLFYLKRANLFVTGHQNGSVKLWNIQLETSITISQKNSPYAHNDNICAFTEYIYVRGTEDITEYMFSAGYEGKINVWQIFIKKNSVQNSLMSSTICPQLKLSFYPNDKQTQNQKIGCQLFSLAVWQTTNQYQPALIISAGTKGQIYFSKMFTYETIRVMKVHEDTINCLLIDQNILFTGSYDHTIKMISLNDFQQLNVFQLHSASVSRLEMLKQTGFLLSQSTDNQLIFWDYTKGEAVKKIKEKKQNILSICYFDEIQMLYFGTQQARIISYPLNQIYNLSSNKEMLKDIDEINFSMHSQDQQLQQLMSGMNESQVGDQ